MSDNRYEDNKYIVMAAEAFRQDRSRENLFRMLDVLLQRMLDEGEAPMAMVDVNHSFDLFELADAKVGDSFTLKEGARLRIDTVSNEPGVEWIPLYMDEDEINKMPTANIHINMSIYDILASGLRSNRASGIVINPFGLALTVPKDILEIVVKRYEEMKSE